LEASINGGAWTAVPAAGTSMYITSGQTLELRHTTGAATSTAYVATIDVGGLTGVTFSTTTAAPVPTVNTPSITTPATGSTGISKTVTITGSAYSAINGAGAHASTDWEIYSDAALTTLVAAASSSADAVNLTSYAIPAGALSDNTQYWVRIRYRDNTGVPVVSAYSTVVDFTTAQQLGLTWTYRGAPLYAASVGVWNGTQFVTSNTNGAAVQTSPDGINWTAAPNIPVNTYLYDLYFDGTTYWAASGATGSYTLNKSTDFSTWSAVTVGPGSQVTYSVASNGTGTVVTTGDFGQVCYSTDNGVTWGSTVIWGGGSSADVWRVRYGNGVFVAAGRSGFSTSTDGSTWTYRGTGGGGFYRTVDYNPDLGEWFATDDGGNFVVSTDNGDTWSVRSTASPYGILWDGSQYWMGTAGNILRSSPDGITWTDRSAALSASGFTGTTVLIMTDGSQLVAVGYSNSDVATSP
jgi:hypothetical protein